MPLRTVLQGKYLAVGREQLRGDDLGLEAGDPGASIGNHPPAQRLVAEHLLNPPGQFLRVGGVDVEGAGASGLL